MERSRSLVCIPVALVHTCKKSAATASLYYLLMFQCIQVSMLTVSQSLLYYKKKPYGVYKMCQVIFCRCTYDIGIYRIQLSNYTADLPLYEDVLDTGMTGHNQLK